MEASCYIHIPFCYGRCDYCDFFSLGSQPDDPRHELFVDKVLEDVKYCIQRYQISDCPTVYLGGGTPSALGPSLLARLLSQLRLILPSPIQELTVELNPETTNQELLAILTDCGVTRISLGIQTFSEHQRAAIGRTGSSRSAYQVLEIIGQYFTGQCSADLMFGLPGQSLASIEHDISFLASKPIDHLSMYNLTVEPGTILDQRIKSGLITLPNDDTVADSWLFSLATLENYGYRQYEVSNFTRQGTECLHNKRYWNLDSWIGCGPSAVSTLIFPSEARAERRCELAKFDSWLAGTEAEIELIDSQTLLKEFIMLSFRQTVGPVPIKCLNWFGQPLNYFIGETLEKWTLMGYMTADSSALNQAGLQLYNRFIVDCLNELDHSYPKYEVSRR